MIRKPNPQVGFSPFQAREVSTHTLRALPPTEKAADKRQEELLSGDQVHSLIEACSRRAPTGLRNRALIALLYCSGLRISEALNLIPDDIDLERGQVRVRHRSSDRSRQAWLFPAAHAYVEAWLVRRRALCLRSDGPLFCTLQGESLKDAYIRAMLPRVARRAQVEQRVHAMGLRNSFAARLQEQDATLEAIRVQLGHADMGSTLACLPKPSSRGSVERIENLSIELGKPRSRPEARPEPPLQPLRRSNF